MQGSLCREYFQMKMGDRCRAYKVETVPQKCKFAACCDTQEKLAGNRKDETAERDF